MVCFEILIKKLKLNNNFKMCFFLIEPKKSVVFSDSVTKQEYKNEEKSRSSKIEPNFQKDLKSLEENLKK